MSPTQRKAMETALTALRKARDSIYQGDLPLCHAAIDAITAALAEADKPVAYLDEGLGAFYWPKEYEKLPHKDFVPLYTHPPRREPLVWRKC